MIFKTTKSRFIDNGNHIELRHSIVVDQSDLTLMFPEDLLSFFPAVPVGFTRMYITKKEDVDQTLFTVIDCDMPIPEEIQNKQLKKAEVHHGC